MKLSHGILAYSAFFLRGAQSQEPICPSCYTITKWIAPPCAPRPCTGPSSPPASDCTQTVPFPTAEISTLTVPGFNPGCPATPTISSYFNCPTATACNLQICGPVTVGTVVFISCSGVSCETVTSGTVTRTATETGLPLECTPTSATDTTETTPGSPTTETPTPPQTPPPFPTFDCDPFDPDCEDVF